MPLAISRAVLKKKKNREDMSSTLPPPRFAESIALSHKLLLPEGFQVRSWKEIESSGPVGNL